MLHSTGEGGQPSWQDLEEAFTALASEDLITQRLKTLRKRAGLDQAELARRLEEAGAPIPQPSISRIESAADAGKAKRRDITVREALALAKVLNVSFSELVLPDGVLPDLEVSRAFRAAAERFHAMWVARQEYEEAARDVARLLQEYPRWRVGLTAYAEKAHGDGIRATDRQLPPAWAPPDEDERRALFVDLLDLALPGHEDALSAPLKRWADVSRRARKLRSEEDATQARARYQADQNEKGADHGE